MTSWGAAQSSSLSYPSPIRSRRAEPGQFLDDGLGVSYPLETDGSVVPNVRCQPIGEESLDQGIDGGIACRSSAQRTEGCERPVAEMSLAA